MRLQRLGLVGLLTGAIALSGCARLFDRLNANGSLVGSTKAPYVVIKQSGGVITDVYKLTSAIVQSEEGSDGWLFLDLNGRPVQIGGDLKSIRFESTDDSDYKRYCEYHSEFETSRYSDVCRDGIRVDQKEEK